MNQMTVQSTWVASGDEHTLIETMGLGCETEAYDPMEKAMLRFCEEHQISTEKLFSGRFVSEYAFTNELKMMGHVWQRDGKLIIAAKGSAERILTICELTDEQRKEAEEKIDSLSSEGLRVIAIAAGYPQTENEVPASITDCRLTLLGLGRTC